MSVELYNLEANSLLSLLPNESVSLILTDPPWNTGGKRTAEAGTYNDKQDHDAYIEYMSQFLRLARIALTASGTLALWTDYRYHPYLCVAGDGVFGRDNRVGEIVIESLLGKPATKNWPVKHSNIALFAKDAAKQQFHSERLPMVDRRAGGQKRVTTNGKTYDYTGQKKIASVISATMSNTDPERVDYPDQKPVWVYETLIRCFTEEGQLVIDPFAGSGTCGAACLSTNRACVLADTSEQAHVSIRKRLNL